MARGRVRAGMGAAPQFNTPDDVHKALEARLPSAVAPLVAELGHRVAAAEIMTAVVRERDALQRTLRAAEELPLPQFRVEPWALRIAAEGGHVFEDGKRSVALDAVPEVLPLLKQQLVGTTRALLGVIDTMARPDDDEPAWVSVTGERGRPLDFVRWKFARGLVRIEQVAGHRFDATVAVLLAAIYGMQTVPITDLRQRSKSWRRLLLLARQSMPSNSTP